jgi:hypothetical protein
MRAYRKFIGMSHNADVRRGDPDTRRGAHRLEQVAGPIDQRELLRFTRNDKNGISPATNRPDGQITKSLSSL